MKLTYVEKLKGIEKRRLARLRKRNIRKRNNRIVLSSIIVASLLAGVILLNKDTKHNFSYAYSNLNQENNQSEVIQALIQEQEQEQEEIQSTEEIDKMVEEHIKLLELEENQQPTSRPQPTTKPQPVQKVYSHKPIVNIYDVTVVSNVSTERLADILRKNNRLNMTAWAHKFVEAEEKYGINALFLASIGIIESSDFKSQLAVNRNNGFGLAAYDYNTNAAMRFSNHGEAILKLAKIISTENCYVAGGVKSVKDIGITYASDTSWATKVSNQMIYLSNIK